MEDSIENVTKIKERIGGKVGDESDQNKGQRMTAMKDYRWGWTEKAYSEMHAAGTKWRTTPKDNENVRTEAS